MYQGLVFMKQFEIILVAIQSRVLPEFYLLLINRGWKIPHFWKIHRPDARGVFVDHDESIAVYINEAISPAFLARKWGKYAKMMIPQWCFSSLSHLHSMGVSENETSRIPPNPWQRWPTNHIHKLRDPCWWMWYIQCCELILGPSPQWEQWVVTGDSMVTGDAMLRSSLLGMDFVSQKLIGKLVGGLEHFLFSYILGIIIPID